MQISVKDRLPSVRGSYLTSVGLVNFHGTKFNPWVEWWLEEVNLSSIEDKRELTATVLVNAVLSLDEQGAKHLVKELCERFHLFPTDEEVFNKTLFNGIDATVFFKKGVDWIINRLKGVNNG